MPYVQLKNLNIHYLEKGAGEKLFILHGLGNNSESWKTQIDELSNYFHVIVWDAPGYGKSSDQSPDFKNFWEFSNVLNEMMEKLGAESVFLLGHSMGAAIAIDFAYRFPDKVDKLILADTPRGAAVISKSMNEEKLKNRIYAIDIQGSKTLAKNRTRNLFSPHVEENIILEAEKIMSQVRGPGYRSVSYSLYNLNQTDIYNKISTPTLLICGELDKITPLVDSEFIHENIQNSMLEIISNTGHLCYMEDSNTFNTIVRDFLIQ